MTITRFMTTLLAGVVALALVAAGPSCVCGGGGDNDGGGHDGGDNDGGHDGGGNDGGDDGGGGGGDGGQDGGPPGATTQVLEYHGGPSRSGVYADPGMTRAAVTAGAVHRDPGFAGTFVGQVYAQPLYFENGGGRPDLVIVATETNNVIALDAVTGGVVWQRALPQPMLAANMPCGNIGPNHGITGTPVIDAPNRALYLSALVGQNNGTQAHHQVFGLSLDDGATLPGWPVDMNATARSGALNFDSTPQGERGALSLVGGKVYVPYGGLAGDCGTYHGWVVGIPTANPASVTAWATRAILSGIWAVGGLASDGTSLYGATGNGPGGAFGDQESVIRFAAGPVYSQANADHFTPPDWQSLDSGDVDISGSSPLLVDMPGSTPSALVVQLGKDGFAYLLNRSSLGGTGTGLQKLRVASSQIIQAGAVYRTPLATYVAVAATGTNCATGSGDLFALKVNPGSPPTLSSAWCTNGFGRTSPMVTTTDGTNDSVVWTVSNADEHLRAFNGDTGQLLFTGTDTVSGMHGYNTTLILAKGRIYVAGDNRVYAFTR
ncbi:MAG TPA: hypothetical protein VIG99_03795 [Myxococcaceae bacterium]